MVYGYDEKPVNIVLGFIGVLLRTELLKHHKLRLQRQQRSLKNFQRDVNIASVNEISTAFIEFNIDSFEVILVAGFKWNFILFRRGLVSGQCVGVDLYCLIARAAEQDICTPLMNSMRMVNETVDGRIVAKIRSSFNGGPRFC